MVGSNAFTSDLFEGKDFNVDNFIINYACSNGLIDKEYFTVGGYHKLEDLLAINSNEMENALSLQEGMQLRKKREILKELFEVLPHSKIKDEIVKIVYPKEVEIFPKEVQKQIKPYATKAEKAKKEQSKEELEKEYYRNLYIFKDNEIKYEYLTNLSDEEKSLINEQLKEYKIKQLEYEINEKEISNSRYSKMIEAIKEWNPEGKNNNFFLSIKHDMIKMLNESISFNLCTDSNINSLKKQLEAVKLDTSKTKFVDEKISNLEYLKNYYSKLVTKSQSEMQQTTTAKKPN